MEKRKHFGTVAGILFFSLIEGFKRLSSQETYDSDISESSNPDQDAQPAFKVKRPDLTSEEIKNKVITLIEDDKAIDPVVITLSGKSSLADYMVVATGQSQRHVGAMADHILRYFKEIGFGSLSSEGEATGDWIVIDVGDVIVHLFRAEIREHYNIEKIWGDLPDGSPAQRLSLG